MTRGELAKRAGVNIETLRYYERQALIPKPQRTSSGYRQYSPDIARRIQFIKRAQMLGFTLNEIADLLDLRVDPTSNCEEVQKHARNKISDIKNKINELTKIKLALEYLVQACVEKDTVAGECPILEAFEHGE